MEKKELKKQISQILIKYNMPTRQIAINEIVDLLPTPSVKGEEFTERETKNFLWGLERGFKDGYTEAYLELGREYDARFREQKSMEYMKVKNKELFPQATEGESK